MCMVFKSVFLKVLQQLVTVARLGVAKASEHFALKQLELALKFDFLCKVQSVLGEALFASAALADGVRVPPLSGSANVNVDPLRSRPGDQV